MFGDNLSFISDTTIAACNGQGCEMKDKFRENFRIALRRVFLINACGTAAEDDSRGSFRPDLFDRGAERDNPAVNFAFPDPAGNQLAVLRTEIQDQDGFVFCHLVCLFHKNNEVQVIKIYHKKSGIAKYFPCFS